MIKVGNILIDPNDISSIHRDLKTLDPRNDKTRGFDVIQIIYKNGVVKNFTSVEVGMSYNDFIDSFMKIKEKDEVNTILRTLTAINNFKHE
jgi:hypothetical protein